MPDSTLSSPQRKQFRSFGLWTPDVTAKFIDLLTTLKQKKPIRHWMDADWVEIGNDVGISPALCKAKKTKLYSQHADICRDGRPTRWRHFKEVHLLKYGSLDKGPQIKVLEVEEESNVGNAVAEDVQPLPSVSGTTGRRKWGIPDKHKLIDVWSEARVEWKLSKTVIRNAKFWLAISEAMRYAGFDYSASECENQMQALLDTFRRIFDDLNSTGRGAMKFWRYYDKLYMIFGKSATMKPAITVAAGTSYSITRNGSPHK